MYEKTTLPNGLRIISAPMLHTRSVSVTIFVGAGSRYESDDIAGISHFIEHMLFKGTTKRPTAREISEQIEGVGGILNAGTDRELTVYWAKVPRPSFEMTVDCLVDLFRNSVFDLTEMEKERKVIIEELHMIHDQPQQLVDLLIDEVMWPNQPLGRDVAGTADSVSGITRQMQFDYLANHYGPKNTVVSIAGNIEHDDVVNLVGGLLGNWEAVGSTSMFPSSDSQSSPSVRIRSKKTEEAHLCLAVRGLHSHHPDRFALDLLNVVLGEGMSSRLFLEIRENRGLCYDVHSYVSRFDDAGALTVYAGVDPKRIDDTIRVALAELARLKTEIVPATEFKKAKDLIKGRMLLRLEDTRSVASSYGNQELLLNQILTADDLVEIIDGIKPEDVMRVANNLFTTDKLNLAVVGNYRREERFLNLLSL